MQKKFARKLDLAEREASELIKNILPPILFPAAVEKLEIIILICLCDSFNFILIATLTEGKKSAFTTFLT